MNISVQTYFLGNKTSFWYFGYSVSNFGHLLRPILQRIYDCELQILSRNSGILLVSVTLEL